MRSVIILRTVVEHGHVVDCEIRQEHPPADAAGMYVPRPRRIAGLLNLLRCAIRMERQRTQGASHA